MRALFIPFGPLGRVGEMVQRRKWTPTEFQIGPSILIEQTVAAASRAGLRESVNAGEGSRMHIAPTAKASNATPVSGSLRVGGEQANNNAAPHNFNTQRN